MWDYFKGEKSEDKKEEVKQEAAEKEVAEQDEPKMNVMEDLNQQRNPGMPHISEIKAEIKDFERDANDQNNLYGRFKKVRKSVKERNTNLEEQHLHPALREHGRVKIVKY